LDEVEGLYRNDSVPRQGLAAEFLLNEGAGDVVHDTTGVHQGRIFWRYIFGATWVKASAG
jgi:hypothetical protein